MISGRGLGATGGTLDKLESIPGYRCEMSNDEFRSIVNWNGCAIAGASAKLAPADKRLYALRDVTATVPSIPLITASILSKKVAEGIEALVLDVKWGSGAFMKQLDSARSLARSLVNVGNRLGVRTSAMITDMNQPLGNMIGNTVEIDESLDVLRGGGPADVVELTYALGAQLLVAVKIATDAQAARTLMKQKIDSGEAYEKFAEMVRSHGGDIEAKRNVAPAQAIVSKETGYVSRINSERLGLAVIEMGGGRKRLGDKLDHSTGIEFLVRLGDHVEAGQPLANLFCQPEKSSYAAELVGASISLSPEKVASPELIVETIE
jgi:pyrimidine-nucleoside phosphorylase